MKKIALVIGLLFATPAMAADNAVIVTPGVGVTMKSKDIGAGVQSMQPILSDASGNTLLTLLGADAVSNTLTGIPVYSRQLFYNGTTWDRWQGNIKAASGAIAAGAFATGAGVDGWDAQAGTTADAAATAGAAGTLAAKVRRLTADIDAIKTAATTPLDNSSVKIDTASAATAQLVAISASTLVRVTAWDVIAGGTGTIKFVYGTGTNCGTGTTDLTGPYPLTAQAGVAKGTGIATLFKGAAGNALCITTTGGVQMSGSVSYQQF